MLDFLVNLLLHLERIVWSESMSHLKATILLAIGRIIKISSLLLVKLCDFLQPFVHIISLKPSCKIWKLDDFGLWRESGGNPVYGKSPVRVRIHDYVFYSTMEFFLAYWLSFVQLRIFKEFLQFLSTWKDIYKLMVLFLLNRRLRCSDQDFALDFM